MDFAVREGERKMTTPVRSFWTAAAVAVVILQPFVGVLTHAQSPGVRGRIGYDRRGRHPG